ncbi:hypothetical protein D3C87_929080 [compost metagenome]
MGLISLEHLAAIDDVLPQIRLGQVANTGIAHQPVGKHRPLPGLMLVPGDGVIDGGAVFVGQQQAGRQQCQAALGEGADPRLVQSDGGIPEPVGAILELRIELIDTAAIEEVAAAGIQPLGAECPLLKVAQQRIDRHQLGIWRHDGARRQIADLELRPVVAPGHQPHLQIEGRQQGARLSPVVGEQQRDPGGLRLGDGLGYALVSQPLAIEVAYHDEIRRHAVDTGAEGLIIALIGLVDAVRVRIHGLEPVPDPLVMGEIPAVGATRHLGGQDAKTIVITIPPPGQPADQTLEQCLALGCAIHRKQIRPHGCPAIVILLGDHHQAADLALPLAIDVGGEQGHCVFGLEAGEGDGVVARVPADGPQTLIEGADKLGATRLAVGDGATGMGDQLHVAGEGVILTGNGMGGMLDEASRHLTIGAHGACDVVVPLQGAVTALYALQHEAGVGRQGETPPLTGAQAQAGRAQPPTLAALGGGLEIDGGRLLSEARRDLAIAAHGARGIGEAVQRPLTTRNLRQHITGVGC